MAVIKDSFYADFTNSSNNTNEISNFCNTDNKNQHNNNNNTHNSNNTNNSNNNKYENHNCNIIQLQILVNNPQQQSTVQHRFLNGDNGELFGLFGVSPQLVRPPQAPQTRNKRKRKLVHYKDDEQAQRPATKKRKISKNIDINCSKMINRKDFVNDSEREIFTNDNNNINNKRKTNESDESDHSDEEYEYESDEDSDKDSDKEYEYESDKSDSELDKKKKRCEDEKAKHGININGFNSTFAGRGHTQNTNNLANPDNSNQNNDNNNTYNANNTPDSNNTTADTQTHNTNTQADKEEKEEIDVDALLWLIAPTNVPTSLNSPTSDSSSAAKMNNIMIAYGENKSFFNHATISDLQTDYDATIQMLQDIIGYLSESYSARLTQLNNHYNYNNNNNNNMSMSSMTNCLNNNFDSNIPPTIFNVVVNNYNNFNNNQRMDVEIVNGEICIAFRGRLKIKWNLDNIPDFYVNNNKIEWNQSDATYGYDGRFDAFYKDGLQGEKDVVLAMLLSLFINVTYM